MEVSLKGCEVLVVGSGGAGLRAAIELKDRGVDVLVVGKCKKNDAHTILATGGINAALGNMDPKDSWQLHAADTIRDGEHINDTNAVITLCKNAPRAVEELASWGCPFHREKNGKISQRFFGAATYRRACFVGDKSGKAILETLIKVANKKKIRFQSETYITSLLTSNGEVNGAIGIDIRNGKIILFSAKAVILCTGGHSRMFKRSSSRFWENNGDGISLACEVGAKFVDMEMFQFHPTGMVYPPEAEGILATEAIRGEGGILLNSKGERFMEKYDPDRMELSARDIVARANYNEIKLGNGTKHGGVWLDITSKPKSYILSRLPRMYEQFKEYAGVDISKERMEVAPTAHYSMGGILIDHLTGKTSVKNLFAIGEVTGGAHGANRLGGNSLAEIIVFGRLTSISVASQLKKLRLIPLDENLVGRKKEEISLMLNSKKGKNPLKVKKEIQELMWRAAGVIRNEKDIQQGIKELRKYEGIEMSVGGNLKMNENLVAALDVRNMIPTCKMILASASYRKESRGAHYRSDYPNVLSKWKKNVISQISEGKVKIKTKPVDPVPKQVARYLTKRKVKSHLLE